MVVGSITVAFDAILQIPWQIKVNSLAFFSISNTSIGIGKGGAGMAVVTRETNSS
jgi:hypothetical protein